jgi:ABC-type dipeptide/oligopeptide/nickel transport system ATPase component
LGNKIYDDTNQGQRNLTPHEASFALRSIRNIHVEFKKPRSMMAIGAPSCGKSMTIDVIATMLGCNVESQATCEVIQSLLNKTTVPLCWDDPTYSSNVKKTTDGMTRRETARKEEEKKFPLQMLCWLSTSSCTMISGALHVHF